MLTHILFQASEMDLLETYRRSYRKKSAEIIAYDEINDKTYDAGSITYSIFDFSFNQHELDDSISESTSGDWGELSFFKWASSNREILEEEVPFLDKLIFFQELDMNISLMNAKNIRSIIETVNYEHNIYCGIIAIETFYANPELGLVKFFKNIGWKRLSEKYWIKL